MGHIHIHVHGRIKTKDVDTSPPVGGTQGMQGGMGSTPMPSMGTNSVMDALFSRDETVIRDGGPGSGPRPSNRKTSHTSGGRYGRGKLDRFTEKVQWKNPYLRGKAGGPTSGQFIRDTEDSGTSEGAKKAAATRGRKFPGYTETPQKGKARPRPQAKPYTGYSDGIIEDSTSDGFEMPTPETEASIAEDWFKVARKSKSKDAESKPTDFGASKAKSYAGGPSMGYSQEGPTKPKKPPEKYQGYDKKTR